LQLELEVVLLPTVSRTLCLGMRHPPGAYEQSLNTVGRLPFSSFEVPSLTRGQVCNLKNGVFWDVTPCGSCKNRRFEGTSASFISVTRIGELGTTLAATGNRRTLRRNTKLVAVASSR
jgi:hypothetical protein